ncbi:MAG: capsule assembly Wzi family protein [Candidatus Acidifodinimicrobium sp.]
MKFFFFLSFLTISAIVVLANSATLIGPWDQNSWMIGAYLSMKGEVLPMESWPLPEGFIKQYLSSTDQTSSPSTISHTPFASASLPYAIRHVPYAINGHMPFAMSPATTTNFFIRFSPEISANNWPVYIPSSSYIDLTQAYRYDSLKPWMVFGYQTNIGNKLYFLIRMDLRKEIANFFEKDDHDNLPFTGLNFSLSPSEEAFDFNFPDEGYASYYSKNFFFNFGRSKLSWGPMTHGLTLSDNSPYYDEGSFIYTTPADFIKRFSFTYNAISVNPILTQAEYYEQSHYLDPMADRIYDEPSKYLFAHRIDFLVTNNFRIGLGELDLVGGKFPDLTDFNPFIIWHNVYGRGYSNSFGSLDFSYVPVKSLQLYGEFALDQDQNPVTPEPTPGNVPADYKPVAYGYGIGAKYSWGDWNDMSQMGVEYYYTLPWMYNRWEPYLKFTNRIMRLSNNPASIFYTDYPFGYMYGPDAQTLNIFFRKHIDNIDIDSGFMWLRKGSNTTLTPYNPDEYYLVTPSGTVEDTKDLYTKVSFSISENLSLFGSMDLRYVKNFMNQDNPLGNAVLGNAWLYDFSFGFQYSYND